MEALKAELISRELPFNLHEPMDLTRKIDSVFVQGHRSGGRPLPDHLLPGHSRLINKSNATLVLSLPWLALHDPQIDWTKHPHHKMRSSQDGAPLVPCRAFNLCFTHSPLPLSQRRLQISPTFPLSITISDKFSARPGPCHSHRIDHMTGLLTFSHAPPRQRADSTP